MGHLFLDIETYAAKTNPASALNPYHPESKVLVIAYNYYEGDRPPAKADITSPVVLTEWESGEARMLAAFLATLKAIAANDPHLQFCGFNILKFDLPYLFGRMRTQGLAGEHELHELLFGPRSIDMLQLSSLISDDTRHKEQLWGIGERDANAFFGIQTHEGAWDDASRFYDAQKYDVLVERCANEFTFEQMLNAFYLYAKRLMKDAA